jgi:hypothetical protein
MEGPPKTQGRHRERALKKEPWCNQDLFFLENTLRRGASFSRLLKKPPDKPLRI